MENVYKELERIGIVPMAVIGDIDSCMPISTALLDAGLRCVEVALRTDLALYAIQNIKEAFPRMLVGAGTVCNVEQEKMAVAAGADYIVTPGWNEEMAQWAIDNSVAIIPGVMTPTEIMKAKDSGLSYLKLFPASQAGGVKFIRSLAAVFPEMRYLPTGGIGFHNLAEYIDDKNVFACGGSWITNGQAEAGEDFYLKINQRARKSLEVVNQTRNSWCYTD